MSRALVIPDALRRAQSTASDPSASAWVSANAGSGKTHVLTQRVLRLLLGGAPPAQILGLTFTKAAAANMASRIFRTLSDWTSLDDEALTAAIVESGAGAPGPAELKFARQLFARTIESPGGLKIQTLHAFCERLLHLFPFEANVPAHFKVVDEREAGELMDEARNRAIAAFEASSENRRGARLRRARGRRLQFRRPARRGAGSRRDLRGLRRGCGVRRRVASAARSRRRARRRRASRRRCSRRHRPQAAPGLGAGARRRQGQGPGIRGEAPARRTTKPSLRRESRRCSAPSSPTRASPAAARRVI